MENNNPLAQYFRTPGVHQCIPTGGQFFKEGEVEFSINQEVAVLPMTAADEIVLKNPDALLNGDALEKLFSSCIPSIKNPRAISVPDMDVLLLAIKLASFGDDLDVTVTCPKCEKEMETTTSVRSLLASVTSITPEDAVVRLNDDIVAYIQPYNFESKVILDLATFEETKLMQHLVDAEISDMQKIEVFNKSFEKIADLNLDLVAKCVRYITIPNGEVHDVNHIKEFIRNTDQSTVKKIREALTKLSENGIPKDFDVVCANEECNHSWKTPMVFDPSHFFD